MKHLILCREYPPAPYPPGGIGTYAAHISRALAERGETVHVIGQRWEGADKDVETFCDGRLIVHRITADDAAFYPTLGLSSKAARAEVDAMLASGFPAQWFSWVAAGLAEQLIAREGIDVIEGQEWEAPLYFLMLRRALGLGPERKPPCIVHLHSPTEYIFRHNEWSRARPDYLPMKRLEDYVIRAADAHLCPSQYLATHCERHYGLAQGSIAVIPLPLGDTQVQARDPQVWETGSICYFGRLEPRKGVIEWVDAAVRVALKDPRPHFEFIGSDLPYTEQQTVRSYVEARIPDALRNRFVFHPAKPRAQLLQMLSRARIAVVPSRWENFPNTCVEAMCTGLPVLATRNGGMAEMIEDGRSGWLAEAGSAPLPDRLAAALERALSESPDQLTKMGEAAAASIHRFCDNVGIAEAHIAVRRTISEKGASRSLRLPACLPWPERQERPTAMRTVKLQPERIAVAVIALRGADPAATLASLRGQTVPPAAIVTVGDAVPPAGQRHVAYPGASAAEARRLVLEEVSDASLWLFLEAGTELQPWAIQNIITLAGHAHEAGLFVCWSGAQLRSTPPAFPYQWLENEADGIVCYRTQAIADARGIPDGPLHEWELATAVMAAGWAAAPIPALLGHRPSQAGSSEVSPAQTLARRRLLAAFPELLAGDVQALVGLLECRTSDGAGSRTMSRESVGSAASVLRRPLREQIDIAIRAARQPIKTTHWALWRAKNIIKRPIFRARDALLGRRS